MATLQIIGGKPLSGTVEPMPNKNSILKLIPAAILADEAVTLHNVPKSSAVREMLKIFTALGGKVKYLKKNTVKLDPSSINSYSITQELAQKERASFMF